MMTTTLNTIGAMRDVYATDSAHVADERDAAGMGVGFDGRFYRYRTYRYELCSDAVAYAELDRYKPQYRERIIQSAPWETTTAPTDSEHRVMEALGITFDGKYYRYGSYRYEHCADAANYAELHDHAKGLTDAALMPERVVPSAITVEKS